MHIVQIASEIAPIAKVGGLADVIYGLSKALIQNKHHVDILLPKYACIDLASTPGAMMEQKPSVGKINVWSLRFESLEVTLLESPETEKFFNRDKIYGFPDDIERFLGFCQIAVEYLAKSQKKIDVLHIHDWPAAAIAPLWKLQFPADKKPAICLTIHNLEHQGKCSKKLFTESPIEKILPCIQDPHDNKSSNLLLGGIVFADAITTVSPTYEKEIKTHDGGQGLEHELVKYSHKISGILNGIDLSFWDPGQDSLLPAHYNTNPPITAEKLKKIQVAKLANRKALFQSIGMTEKKAPLITCVTRLVWQKGPALLQHAIRRALEKKAQFVLIGSTHSDDLEKEFLALQKELKGNKDVCILLNKKEPIIHLIYAAADMFIIPSIFEPCGLTQMISMRYGTIPIARKTGGLQDTVFDVETSTVPADKRNGYTFDHADAQGVNWALDRAIDCWYNSPAKWQALMQNAMNSDFSWSKTVLQYVQLYKKTSDALS